MTYIIAEIGNNHNGSIKKCMKLFDAASSSGAHAVKIQSFTGKDIVSPEIKSSVYKNWDSKGFEYWYEFLDSIALPLSDHQTAIDYANELGLDFITTPVTPNILNYLEKLDGIKSYKLASMDLTNLDLINSLSQTDKSIIMSTFLKAFSEFNSGLTPLNFLFINLFSVSVTSLKFLFFFEDLINCWPILPMQPEIAKLIFFI